MKPAPWNDDALQQAFDGMPPEGADLQTLQATAEGKQRIEKLRQLRQHLQRYAEERGTLAASESDALFARVMDTVSSAGDASQERNLRLLVEPDQAETSKAREHQGALGSAPAPLRQERERWPTWLPAAGVLAAAAALLVVYFGAARRLPHSALTTAPYTVTVSENPFGSEVVEADFGHNIGTIFEVEGNAGEPIAVVWISDDMLEGQEPTETLQ